MKTTDDIEWKESIKYQGDEPSLIPNVKIGEKIKDNGSIYTVQSIYFFGRIVLRNKKNGVTLHINPKNQTK